MQPFLAAAGEVETPARPVTDTYHGVAVRDDYQWLENKADPEVRQWIDKENAATRDFLDKLPERKPIAERLTALYAKSSAAYGALVARPGRLFALKFQPPKQQPLLVTLASANDLQSEKVVLDPNELDPTGGTSMDWFAPSQDGQYVAVSLSKGGSEAGTLHFYQTADGKALPDTIEGVQYPTAGGSAAWSGDGTRIFYTRFPRKGERPDADLHFYQQVFCHKLHSPESEDTYALGKDFPRIAEISLNTSHDGRLILATVANGDGGDYAHYILDDPEGADIVEWRQLTHFEDGIKSVVPGWDDALYLLSRKDAPRGKVLKLAAGSTDLGKAKEVVPESKAVIAGIEPARDSFYVTDIVGGPSRLRFFRDEGGGSVVPTPPVSSIQQVLPLDNGQVLFRAITFLEPYAWYLHDPYNHDKDTSLKTALAGTSPVNFDNCEVAREFAVSKDGTRVPISILRRKDCKRDGANPALLYGYGGYGISISPNYDISRRLWMDRGGVFAVANIRGGGEFGEQWHKEGNLTHKQNVFDDFAACAQHLIDAGYTKPAKLAIQGGSNGGLLMGAVLTQHPGLVRAVVSSVGIYDSLRSELEPNGAFNVTEFGTVKDPEQFKALYAYSPYHHVADGGKYPAVFLLAGLNDGRVAVYHSLKMAARLQRATGSGLPGTATCQHALGPRDRHRPHGTDRAAGRHLRVPLRRVGDALTGRSPAPRRPRFGARERRPFFVVLQTVTRYSLSIARGYNRSIEAINDICHLYDQIHSIQVPGGPPLESQGKGAERSPVAQQLSHHAH